MKKKTVQCSGCANKFKLETMLVGNSGKLVCAHCWCAEPVISWDSMIAQTKALPALRVKTHVGKTVVQKRAAKLIKIDIPYPDWLRKAASKGGRLSRRKLTKKEAKRMAAIRWKK